MKVCRSIQAGEDGLPIIGATARKLGARPGKDIPLGAKGKADLVVAATGGMSVSPLPPANLPRSFRPPEHGGTGKDPVWTMELDELPRGLRYRPDPDDEERHGFIEPSFDMPFETYQELIHSTRVIWERV